MKTEKSCGAVVFTFEQNQLRYVIIQSKEGIYGFPKGHMQTGETECQTALREIKEETGLDVKLLDGFRTEDSHPVRRADGTVITKHIVYFLAKYSDQTPVPQASEISVIQRLNYETAMASFQFESSRRILREANEFILKNRIVI